MTTTRRYRFLSKFQNGELYALCGYEKESKKDMALLTVYYLFPLSSLLLLLLLLLLSSLVMIIIIIIIIIIFNTYIALFILKYSKAHYNIIKN